MSFKRSLLVTYLCKPALPHEEHFKYFYKFRIKYQTVCLWVTVSDSIHNTENLCELQFISFFILTFTSLCIKYFKNINLRIYSVYLLYAGWTLICDLVAPLPEGHNCIFFWWKQNICWWIKKAHAIGLGSSDNEFYHFWHIVWMLMVNLSWSKSPMKS